MARRKLKRLRRALSLRSLIWDKLPNSYHRNPGYRKARAAKSSRRRWRRRYTG